VLVLLHILHISDYNVFCTMAWLYKTNHIYNLLYQIDNSRKY